MNPYKIYTYIIILLQELNIVTSPLLGPTHITRSIAKTIRLPRNMTRTSYSFTGRRLYQRILGDFFISLHIF